MQCTRSIGLADLVALMATHRSASKRNEGLAPEEFDRVAAYLRNTRRGLAPDLRQERQRRFCVITQQLVPPG